MTNGLKIGFLLTASILLFQNCKTRSKISDSSTNSDGTLVTDPKDLTYRSTVALIWFKDDGLTDAEKATGKKIPTSFCSGTLISKKHILTAAHCFFEIQSTPERQLLVNLNTSNKYVGFGQNINISEEKLNLIKIENVQFVRPLDDAPITFVVPAARADIKHPSPSQDIAIITIAEDAPDIYVPAKLPKSAIDASIRKLVSAGYGITGTSKDEGDRGTLRKSYYANDSSNFSWTRFICKKPVTGGSLPGDSGGPLFDEVTGELLGVSSHHGDGKSCFTDVFHYTPWIKTILAASDSEKGLIKPLYENDFAKMPIIFLGSQGYCWDRKMASASIEINFSEVQDCNNYDLNKLFGLAKSEEHKEFIRSELQEVECKGLAKTKMKVNLNSNNAKHIFNDSIYETPGASATNLFFSYPVPNFDKIRTVCSEMRLSVNTPGCKFSPYIGYCPKEKMFSSSGSPSSNFLKFSYSQMDSESLYFFEGNSCKKVPIGAIKTEIDGLYPCFVQKQ